MNKQTLITIGIAIVAIFVATFSVKMYYENKVEERSGVRQLADLDKDIANLDVEYTDVTALVNSLSGQLADAVQKQTNVDFTRQTKINKKKQITTAIYYLNKSLGIQPTTGSVISGQVLSQ